MRTLIIDSEIRKRYCKSVIDEMPLDGSETVIFKKTDVSSTAKQRQLQWLWYTETATSGLGSDDTKDDVHVRAKMMWAHPILMRDDPVYPILYNAFKKAVRTSESYGDKIKEFANQYISTERLTRKQRAEYLSDYQKYWTDRGVALTDPSLQGLDENLGYVER